LLSQRVTSTKDAAMKPILVTGGSGFIGCHCILQLLAAGHRVRTTVRSPKREADVRVMLKAGGAEPGNRLSFVTAEYRERFGLAGSRRRMRLRTACGIAVSSQRSKA
jgi:nucleoside-diphosphate-sugar epimerase